MFQVCRKVSRIWAEKNENKIKKVAESSTGRVRKFRARQKRYYIDKIIILMLILMRPV